MRLSFDESDYIACYKNEQGKIIGGVKFSQINKPYRNLLFDNSNVQILFGGGSSGKSFFVFQRTILDVWLQGRNFLVARQKKNSLENSVYTELIKKIHDFNLEDKFEWKKNPMVITCKENNRQILFCGLDDIESVKSIVPIDGTFTDVIIEEATEIQESDFDQLRVRQRGVCFRKFGKTLYDEILTKRITIMFNPINIEHWIYKRFFLGKWVEGEYKKIKYKKTIEYTDPVTSEKKTGIETYLICHTTYKDNTFLSIDDIIKLEGIEDPYQRAVYVEGKFGVLGNVIFKRGVNWEVRDLSKKKNSFENIRMGLDFGGSIDPYAFTKLSIDFKNKTIYLFDEFYLNQIDIETLWKEIKPKAETHIIFCDRDDDKIRQLKKLGANIHGARKGKNSIINGIEWLKTFKIVVDKSCVNSIMELETYTWMKDRFGNSIQIPVDKNNHIIDSLRYACSYDMVTVKRYKSNISVYNIKRRS